jgi:hypothetical protein
MSVQHRFVVMAGIFSPSRRRVVALFLTDPLELVELLLLIVREMGQVPRGILHRLDSLEVRHGRDNVGMLYRRARGWEWYVVRERQNWDIDFLGRHGVYRPAADSGSDVN